MKSLRALSVAVGAGCMVFGLLFGLTGAIVGHSLIIAGAILIAGAVIGSAIAEQRQ